MYDQKLVEDIYFRIGIFKPRHLGILNHMTGVAHVAGYLARMLNDSTLFHRDNVEVDVGLVTTGAMLHDIGKVFDESDKGHVIEGVGFLSRTVVGGKTIDTKIINIVERHQVENFQDGEIPEPSSWEEKLVFLADLLFGDYIAPFPTRMNDIIARYGHRIPRGEQWLRDKAYQLHAEVSSMLSPKPFPF